jgi:hypothetical protein
MNLSKKTIVLASTVGILAIGGGTTAAVMHNNEVKQEQAEKKAYDAKIDKALSAIDIAYKTRKTEDVTNAKDLVAKLHKADQKAPSKKIATLETNIKLIAQVDSFVKTAETSKKDTDITKAQKANDELKDAFFSNDKKTFQTRLDKVKKAVADAKTKAENDAKAKAETQQAAQTTTDDPTTYGDESAPNNGYVDPGYAGDSNTGTGNGGYVAPPATGGGNNVGSGGGSVHIPGDTNGDGIISQEERNQMEIDASTNDPNNDPNAPWNHG